MVAAMPPLTFFHTPRTRSTGVLILLEELGVPYTLELVDQKREQQLSAEYRAINPMGKVPALQDGETIVTEQVAIFLHLADRHPELGLAPPPGDPLRGRYLRWMVFYAASFEPALVDHAMKREPGRRGMSPYGDYDTVIDAIAGMLEPGPWILGQRFSAADLLWGIALGWTMMFGMVPERPVFRALVDRVNARPAVQRARAKDEEVLATMAG